MKRERASALCFRRQQSGTSGKNFTNDLRWLLVRLRDPGSGTLYRLPPGGEIGEGESPIAAAKRETWEETGVRAKVFVETELVVDYVFYWGGTNYECRTHFFLGEFEQEDCPSFTEEYIEGHDWVTTDTLLEQIKFHPKLAEKLGAWVKSHEKVFSG